MHTQENALNYTLLISGTVLLIIMSILTATIIRYHRRTIVIRMELKKRGMNILESERKRLTYDLHDALAPLMTAIHIRLNLMEPDKQKDASLIAEMKSLLKQTTERIKEVSANLVPKSLQAEGLSIALKDLVRMMSVTNKVTIRYHENRYIPRMQEDRELHVYRMVEEILSNAGRHATANKITLQVSCQDDTINITVKDDGIGFNPVLLPKEKLGLGLRHILFRTEILKGEIFFESTPLTGTSYLITIPI